MILETIAGLAGLASSAKDLRDFTKEARTDSIQLEEVLAETVEVAFNDQITRLRHLCRGQEPRFEKHTFIDALQQEQLPLSSQADLESALIPILACSVIIPTEGDVDEDTAPVYASIIRSALRGMLKRLSRHQVPSNEMILGTLQSITAGNADSSTRTDTILQNIEALKADFENLKKWAQDATQHWYDERTDSAPPPLIQIDNQEYINPFTEARAEDFNHNYSKLARLFQRAPEWESIQKRTDNVFIEGGRGTGKSMLLRRLTAQATVAGFRLDSGLPSATYDDVKVDYFGIYMKLPRGYYDRFNEAHNRAIADLLAQHELNIEIFASFVDTLLWLRQERALPSTLERNPNELIEDLNSLFPDSPDVHTLDQFKSKVVKLEQDQINRYFRNTTFGINTVYNGSACPTIEFIRNLGEIFRRHLFPAREIRLFLLIDEFESLTETQQIALNTVIKMRMTDIALKIGVRKLGRKTSSIFTVGDPIQDPRDYLLVRLDYDIRSQQYLDLLRGIAEKRLRDAQYPETDIRKYLVARPADDEIPQKDIDVELTKIWQSGRRRNETMGQEFVEMYSLTALYRCVANKGKAKSHTGFKHFAQLSSGIISNYMELCKYAFHFALKEPLLLREDPTIPSYLQSEAAYYVSQRLLYTVAGNVEEVGGQLTQLLTDLAAIVRARLLNHPSEPEANRFTVTDFGSLGLPAYKDLKNVLEGAIVWSVLQKEGAGEAFLSKNHAQPTGVDLIINRIYAPALKISPRTRWRINITLSELSQLLDANFRETVFQVLMRSIGKVADPQQKSLPLEGIEPSSAVGHTEDKSDDTKPKTDDIEQTDGIIVSAADKMHTPAFRKWAGADFAHFAIVFTDLVGSTGLGLKIGDHDMSNLQKVHFAYVRSLVEQNGGYSLETAGDSFLLVFKNCADALNFAVILRQDAGDPQLQARAAIHSGEVMVRDDGIFGGEINYTHRVMEQAEGAELWISDHTHHAIDRLRLPQHAGLKWEKHTKNLKGFSDSEIVWLLQE